MQRKKQEKLLCVDDLRHAEYYHMQRTFDTLYAQSQSRETFTNLMDTILARENILLAYRNIKSNDGSYTPGTDNLTIRDIGRLTPDEVVEKVRYIVAGSKHGYRPKPVRRKNIPKPNGSTRPLGIPCIWDRLVQQCIKQVMEPICEAKFSNHSYGFRPQRSVEHAIQRTYVLMQRNSLHYVIEFDIKGFFDNVNHTKLIRQIWAMGIQDKHLIYVIRKILMAPIKMPNGKIVTPTMGTPQGGIISPLLANIVLNELDHWVESQWTENPIARKYRIGINPRNGSEILSSGYASMRRKNLKEMHIVRYADDFRIFCRSKKDAQNTMIAVTQWLKERLKLDVSPEKTRIVNVKRHYSEFLGFKIKVHPKGSKYTVRSRMCDKALQKQNHNLVEQAYRVAKPGQGSSEKREIVKYNAMVLGIQNYYRIATDISKDCRLLHRAAMTVFTNRLRTQEGARLVKTGRELRDTERKLYGKSAQLRFVAGSDEPIYPIGYIRHKFPMAKKLSVNPYTPQGRMEIHENLRINTHLMWQMMNQSLPHRSAEYADNRLSLFSAQWGKCAITGQPFAGLDDIHCHHKNPLHMGGTDKYDNLILVQKQVHRLIHATKEDTIQHYVSMLNLSAEQVRKLNRLRLLAGCNEI